MQKPGQLSYICNIVEAPQSLQDFIRLVGRQDEASQPAKLV